MKLAAALLFWLLLLLLGLSVRPAPAQKVQPAASSPASTLRVSSNLVLVPVVATDPKNGLPDKSLQRADFQVFDKGPPVSIQTFDIGGAARPFVLWFVVQCSMPGEDTHGSGFFRGQIHLLEPALKYLDKQDTVAVAHWCDTGDSKLDLLPTSQAGDALAALEQVLAPKFDAADHDRTGELALQKTLQLIVDATRLLTPEPVPVVVFLYGDHSGMPKAEADHFIDELLETSAIVYGLRDRRSPQVGWMESRLWGEQAAVATYLAMQTGGQYLTVTHDAYEKGLEEILQQLHFRYELGFIPEALDGKRHPLIVKLADAAKKQHKGMRLRYRLAYVSGHGTS
jgi:hypothetical protein